jgi:hypothetical protein
MVNLQTIFDHTIVSAKSALRLYFEPLWWWQRSLETEEAVEKVIADAAEEARFKAFAYCIGPIPDPDLKEPIPEPNFEDPIWRVVPGRSI